MLYSCQSAISRIRAKLMPILMSLCILSVAASAISAEPLLPDVPKKPEWQPGPFNASIPDLADIRIPQGYSFMDAKGGKEFLEKMNNIIPAGLVGLVATNSHEWYVILQYAEVGHVKEETASKMDVNQIMAAMQERVDVQNAQRSQVGLPPVSKLEWAIQPTYVPTTKTLEWAVTAETDGKTILNHTVRLLSRKGVLDAIAVRPYAPKSDLTSVRQLMSGVRFQNGQQYADYRPGDKQTAKTLTELIVVENALEETKPATATGMSGVWVSMAVVLLVGCFVAAGGTVLVKKLRSRAPVTESEQLVEASHAPEPAVAPTTPAVQPRPVLIKTRPKAADFKVRPGVNGSRTNGANQRRAFDYNRYFTDLMANVYTGSYGADMAAPVDGYEEANGYSVNYANGSNGANGKSHADVEILATQRTLIEEQRKLIMEQSKLIEEKSRLIEEKNEILRLQSELMRRKLV